MTLLAHMKKTFGAAPRQPGPSLVELTPDESWQAVIETYRQADSGTGLGYYSSSDWGRLKKAFSLVRGDTVLDVGVGNGALLNALVASGHFQRVVGVDIRKNSKLILPDNTEFRLKSVTELNFADDEFDTVVCMEVLEHLEKEDLFPALSQLRRVARTRLVVTLPYCEPEPVWWHDKPGGHRQSFDDEKLKILFPCATGGIVRRADGTDWVMLIEEGEVLQNAPEIASAGSW